MAMSRDLQEKFHKAVYNNLRAIPNMTDKLAITNIFLTAYHDGKMFADLLYGGNDLQHWLERINDFFGQSIGTTDKLLRISTITFNEKNCFRDMVEESKKAFDNDGYYKALYGGDEYAIAVYEVCKVVEKIDWKRMEEDWRCVGKMISEHT